MKKCFLALEEKLKIVAFLMAVVSTFGLAWHMIPGGQNASLGSDILLIPCCWVFYKAWRKCLTSHETKGFYFFTGGMSLLFAMFLVCGKWLENNMQVKSNSSIQIVLQFLLLTAAIYPVLALLTLWLNQKNGSNPQEKQITSQKVLRICFGVIIIVWLLGYSAMFPGVYGVDAPAWYLEFSNRNVPISSQWSFVYGAIFYGLVSLGHSLSGSYEIGFALFSFVQLVFVLYVVRRILQFLGKYFSARAVILAAAFFTLVPTHVILTLTSAQDAAFTACFAICIIYLLEMGLNPESYWKNTKHSVAFVLWLLLLCTLRNNGLYAMLILIIFALLEGRQHRRQLILTLGIAVFAVLIYQGPVLDALGVQKGTAIREMLSMPLQQMANVYVNRPDILTNEEKVQMQAYIPDKSWKFYTYSISDPIKGALNTQKVKKDPKSFLKLYLEIGARAPKEYTKAALLQTIGLWYPNKSYPDPLIWHPYLDYPCMNAPHWKAAYIDIKRMSLFPLYNHILGDLFGTSSDFSGYGGDLPMAFSYIPLLSTFCKAGTYFWLVLYLFFYALYRRWKAPLLAIGFCVGLTLTIILSPVILYRYYAPIIFSAPLLVAILFLPWNRNVGVLPLKQTIQSNKQSKKRKKR